MKILLANISLEHLAGSETWTITMHHQLSKMGHDVDVYVSSGEHNNLIDKSSDKNTHYDVGIINHNKCLTELEEWDIGKRILTSHGVIPGPETPVKGADKYVAVSEEVQDNLAKLGFESVIIRNPINTEYFSYAKPNKKLERILWMNNRDPMVELIELASDGFDMKVQSGWKPDVKEKIHWADLVISSGRGIYEALSCGKNAMVVNWCGCDGMVTEDSILDLRETNCSGRFKKEFWLPEKIRNEFSKYDCERNMRPYIIKNNNVAIAAERYLTL